MEQFCFFVDEKKNTNRLHIKKIDNVQRSPVSSVVSFRYPYQNKIQHSLCYFDI